MLPNTVQEWNKIAEGTVVGSGAARRRSRRGWKSSTCNGTPSVISVSKSRLGGEANGWGLAGPMTTLGLRDPEPVRGRT